MLTLRDIMTTDIVTVGPDIDLHQLAEVLSGRGISGAPVVEGEAVVGVISTSDLLDVETTTPGAPRFRDDGSDWGEYDVADDESEQPSSSYYASYWADAGVDVLERIETPESPEWNHLGERTVGEAMTPTVWSLAPDAPVREAARLMLENRIHRVLVVEDGTLVGIVAASDIVRAVAERGLCE
ncbi:MAG: CBS domain-containing protein [Gemmatimonadota bacterium]|nr:CBS domain-containing protein [Gemmatimonadota bacterium]